MKKDLILVFGNFNIVHPGHLRLLHFAKSLKGKVKVGLFSDKIAGKDIHIPEELRMSSLEAIDLVDEVFIVNEPVEDVINRLKPRAVVKGKEYEGVDNPEKEVLESYGGKLFFSSGEVTFSSIELLQKEVLNSDNRFIETPQNFFDRHQITVQKLIEIVEKFKDKKVCVIGDVIIDEYIASEPLGMSQEDPTIVIKPIESKKYLGGAGIVAAHGSNLGAKVTFHTIVGDDEEKKFVKKELTRNSVSECLFIDPNRPTTLKQRFRSKGKSLLRVSYLSQNSISKELQNEIFASLEKQISNFDLIIFSDFNYGCLPQDLVQKITLLANKHNVRTAADSQSSSQTGDISRFKNMDLITPTEREARISLRDNESGLVRLAENLRLKTDALNILLKLGEEGLMLHAGNPHLDEWVTDRIRALNTSPKDVAGAGDSLLITSSLALLSGANIWEAASLGSLAAAIQVGRVGNTPITSDEIINNLKSFKS
tara:strand:+ start:5760 stop:7205 length:1446 start_codon:yes stop_codon:yes gene_type:complete